MGGEGDVRRIIWSHMIVGTTSKTHTFKFVQEEMNEASRNVLDWKTNGTTWKSHIVSCYEKKETPQCWL